MREFITWEHEGVEITQLTAISKRETLIDYGRKYNLRTFVETGTCEGDTIEYLLPHFDKLYSIEINEYRYKLASERFKDEPKVRLFLGNSGTMLPWILKGIHEPALYWLDAHLEGPPTGLGPNTPLMEELHAIIAQGKEGFILVDDMDFGKNRELVDGILRIELKENT